MTFKRANRYYFTRIVTMAPSVVIFPSFLIFFLFCQLQGTWVNEHNQKLCGASSHITGIGEKSDKDLQLWKKSGKKYVCHADQKNDEAEIICTTKLGHF